MPAMKMTKLVLAAVFATGSVVAILACSDDTTKTHVEPLECEAISGPCHDVQTPAAQECHESAENTWTAAECTANLTDCLAKCPVPDAGPPSAIDAAEADAETEEDAETP
jgi:hypothetical protein